MVLRSYLMTTWGITACNVRQAILVRLAKSASTATVCSCEDSAYIEQQACMRCAPCGDLWKFKATLNKFLFE